MMIFDQSFRISAFGNFEDIRPTTDNMQYVLEEFSKKGFLPSIFQEMIIPGNNGQLSQQQRIALVSGDGRKQVSISSNRLDYDVKFSDEYSLSADSAKELNKEAAEVIGALFNRFSKKSNRIALNTQSLLRVSNDDELSTFISKFRNPVSIYSGILDEWSTRMMVVKECVINSNPERANIITNVMKGVITKTVDGERNEMPGFVISCDINTVPQQVLRFTEKDILEFIDYSIEQWITIREEMK